MTGNSTPDKVAVVTGASSGIGAATARALVNNAGVMLLGPFGSGQRATSPRSSPSSSAAHGTWPSTRSCCDQQGNSDALQLDVRSRVTGLGRDPHGGGGAGRFGRLLAIHPRRMAARAPVI
jgi:NAD(P)-dependent dehydrogenase (short-subunit alcohol dehydrogenase family)